MNNDKISIIMGVYNCEDTLGEAIESLLSQTYTDWELIVCDDCSTDSTYAILQDYKRKDPNRIILLKNKKNSKLAYTLNKCLEKATGHYVARMDGDDVSSSDRFEKQVNFLQNNPNIDLVGTAMQRFNKDGLADIVVPIQKPDKFSLKNEVPFNHATIMTYKYVYEQLNGYTVSTRTMRSQDYDLWFRFFHNGFQGKNILEPLYYVRENEDAIKRRTFKVRFNAYKTTLIGFKLLNYPLHWYIKPTCTLLIKGIVPVKIVLAYRKYQAYKFNNNR